LRILLPDMAAVIEAESLGTVLVIGGCGFLGTNIVKLLLSDPACSSVHVLSRNPTSNLQPGVTYHAGDITNGPNYPLF
jgi:sterol-4alpha-carboxylate 3-dehydrogenase (decarboxylating)